MDKQKVYDTEDPFCNSSVFLHEEQDCDFEAYFSCVKEFPGGSRMCQHPSVCLNNNGVAVLFYTWLNRLYYRVGRYQDGHSTLMWGPDVFFHAGSSPEVTLSDKNTLVVVRNHLLRRLSSFRVGVVDEDNLKIEMMELDVLTNGINPSVTLINSPVGSEDKLLILYHSRNHFKYDCLYSIAKITDQERKIAFVGLRDQKLPELDDSTKMSVSADKEGTLVILFENILSHCLSYVVGKLENNRVVISEVRKFTIGYCPQVCLVGDRKATESHEAALGSSVVFKYGRVRDDKIYWCKGQKYKSGYTPSVTSNGDHVLEVHVSLLGTLQYRTGFLKDV